MKTQFFPYPLRPRLLAGFLASVVVLLLWAHVADSADTPPLRICLLSASNEYESDKSLADFQSYLENRYRVTCQRAFGKDKGDSLPGLEALDTADLMIVFTRRIKLPVDQLERIKKYVASGRPIIGLRTASHAFENYMEFDREVLGGGYKGHYTNALAEVQIAPGQTGHPVLAGVKPFISRKLYKNPSLADNDTVLLKGSIPGHTEPVAWVRRHGHSRVFYTSLGVQEDFTRESFRQLLVNAVFWTSGRDEAASRRPSQATSRPAP
jgi:type 1 glutamine amidotransferase